MTDQDSVPEDIIALLPWYATGKLTPREAALVESALAANADLRSTLGRIEEEREETVLLNQSIAAPVSDGIDRLFARIEAEAPNYNRGAELGLLAHIARLLGFLRPRALALAAVAAALVILAESGALISLLAHTVTVPDQYTTASAEPSTPPEQAVLLVSFVAGASLDAVSALLRAEHATIIDGPMAGGLFRVTVAAADAASVLAEFRGRPDLVRFAGPSK